MSTFWFWGVLCVGGRQGHLLVWKSEGWATLDRVSSGWNLLALGKLLTEVIPGFIQIQRSQPPFTCKD